MLSYALKMLIGDRGKFVGMILGLTFATFIITQQSAIFVGLMQRTFGFLTDTPQPDIWVVDQAVNHVDDIKPLKSTQLFNVRSISGVRWAVPLFKGELRLRVPRGVYQNCTLIGVDDNTLIGGPPKIIQGSILGLREPFGVIVDIVAAKTKLASKDSETGQLIPMTLGEIFEINDKRAQVKGFCQITRTFRSQPVIYTSLQQALNFAPSERNLLSYIMVKAEPGTDVALLCNKIEQITGLAAYTKKQFEQKTIAYYMIETGIPLNFGVAVFLGFIIGTAICGQTFYNFVSDNLKYFAAFKAMGASTKTLIQMIFLQAFFTASIGWGFGMGLTALFGFASAESELSFSLPLWLYLLSGFSIYLITLFSALLSITKLMQLEPSEVFQS